jgi:amylosucrase
VRVHDEQFTAANQPETISGQIYQQLQQLIRCRARLPVLGHGETKILSCSSPHLFSYQRTTAEEQLLCLVNFSEHMQQSDDLGHGQWLEQLTGKPMTGNRLMLKPYQVLWLSPL